MPKAPDERRSFESLLKVVVALRGPDGCPWDKEQDHRTLTRYAIEEAHEWAEAVDQNDPAEMRSELGDLLFQVVLNAEIARQQGAFDVHDVIETLNEKMIRRHPHVFGDVIAKTAEDVLQNWAEIKAREKGTTVADDLTFNIPRGLPALLRAEKIGAKTADLAFDFDGPMACWQKVEEELQELREARTPADRQSELGDILFSLVQWARHSKIDAEQSLRESNQRFEARLTWARRQARSEGKNWTALSDADRDIYWERAKHALKVDKPL